MRLLLAVLAALVFAAPAHGASFIAPTGNDANFCTSAPGDACLSVGRGVATTTDNTVVATPGSYGAVSILGVRPAAQTTIQGAGAVFGSINMRNSSNMTWVGTSHTGTFAMQSTSGTSGPVSNITISRARFDGGCVQAFNKATNIVLEKSTLSHCLTGFSSPRRGWSDANHDGRADLVSNGITIRDDTFKDMTGDAVQIGNADNVLIADNTFSAQDPNSLQHNDCVQILGDDVNVRIVGDSCSGPSQGYFAQAYFLKDANGVGHQYAINNLAVENSLVHDADSFAVRFEGVTGGKINRNVLCLASGETATQDGGIYVGPSTRADAPLTWSQPSSGITVDKDFVGGTTPYKTVGTPSPVTSQTDVVTCGAA